MEPNFQTSFIPKKPIVRDTIRTPHTIGLLTVIAIFVLFAVAAGTGALFFYKGIQTKKIATMKNNLDLAKSRFEPAKIEELQRLDKRLNASNKILAKHIAVTPIFQGLQAITMKSVRFTKFSYTIGEEKNAKINVKMSGITLGYSFLALQSDLFAQNKNFIDPVFSNLALNEAGNVTFDLDFFVDPSFVDYKTMLLTESKNSDNASLESMQTGT